MRTLLIDDMRSGDVTVTARTFNEGIRALTEQGPFDILYLDHDLGEDEQSHTGMGIMDFLEINPQYLPKVITIVSSNPVGRRNMQVVIDRLYNFRNN